MHRARCPIWILAVAAIATASAAAATPVNVLITGTWDSVVDNGNVLGGTVTAGTSYSVSLVYDDAATDTDPSANIGSFSIGAGSSDLSITTSTFTFTPGNSAALLMGVENDNDFGEDRVLLFVDGYTATGLPAGVSLSGTRFANPTFTDTSGTAHASDSLTGLPWTNGSYDITDFYFIAQVAGAGPGKFIELAGTVTSFALLPEPSSAALGVLALLAIAAVRIRG
jgi:hypothetical protein